MSEFLEKLETLITDSKQNNYYTRLPENEFIRILAISCVQNGLKYRHYKKIVFNNIASMIKDTKCSDGEIKYGEDDLEYFYDEAKESKETFTIEDLDNYLKCIREEDKKVEDKKETREIEYEKNPIHDNEKYQQMKKYFEETVGWCKFNHPAFYGKVLKNSEGTTFEKEDNPKTFFENKEFSITQNKKTVWYNFFDVWKKDPEIRTYERIVFDPTRKNQNDLNLFSDYCSIANDEKRKEIPVDRVLEHINSICGYDNQCYEYFLNYIAHIVQHPEQRNDVAVVMYGREGVGKNMILQLIGDIIGSKYYGESSEPRDLFGQFATGMYRRLMFVYDESEKKDTAGFMNRLKTLVTGVKLRVELKGKDSFEVDNYCRLFFPTNNQQPFPITKGNRRWFYLKASSKYVQLSDDKRHPHFQSLALHFNDKNLQYSFYKFLMNRDISKFNASHFPKSEGLQQAMQVPLILRCFHSEILSKNAKGTLVYSASKLLDIVIKYCKDNNYNSSAYNPTSLSNELIEYIDNGCLHKRRTGAGIKYQFDTIAFNKYIKQNSFNLDDISTCDEDDSDSVEKINLQIEQHRKIIQELRGKLLNQCNVMMGEDSLTKGIDRSEQQVKVPTVHNTTQQIKKEIDYSKRLLPVTKSKPSVLSKVDSAIFNMSLD